MLGLYEHLERELETAGFFHPPEKTAGSMVQNLRSALGRARFTEQEVRTLRGVVTALSKGRGRVLEKLARRRRRGKGREMSLAGLLDSLPIPIIQAPMVGRLRRTPGAGGLAGPAAWARSPPAPSPPDEIGPAVGAMRAGDGRAVRGEPVWSRHAKPAAADVEQRARAARGPGTSASDAPLPDRPNRFAPRLRGPARGFDRAPRRRSPPSPSAC